LLAVLLAEPVVLDALPPAFDADDPFFMPLELPLLAAVLSLIWPLT